MTMGRFHLLLQLLLVTNTIFLCSATMANAKGHHQGLVFIHASCKHTRYPQLCNRCLSIYAPTIGRKPRKLAIAALSVSLNHARSTRSYVRRSIHASTSSAISDCIENISDGIYQIRQSIAEMEHLGMKGTSAFFYHVGNVQTWVSAALTDETTCLDGLSEAKGRLIEASVKAAIRRRVVMLAQVTSNALALVNKVAKGAHY